MVVTWQTIITAGAVVAALSGLVGLLVKLIRWVDKQSQQNKQQNDELNALREQHNAEMEALRNDIASELTLLTYGVLACLKGQQEQGCNGPVTEAINKIERYLNKKAHTHEGGF